MYACMFMYVYVCLCVYVCVCMCLQLIPPGLLYPVRQYVSAYSPLIPPTLSSSPTLMLYVLALSCARHMLPYFGHGGSSHASICSRPSNRRSSRIPSYPSSKHLPRACTPSMDRNVTGGTLARSKHPGRLSRPQTATRARRDAICLSFTSLTT